MVAGSRARRRPLNGSDPRTPSCRRPRADREQKQRTCIERHDLTGKQIIEILKEHEAGVSVADLCRKHGVSDASIYNWKWIFEARRLKALEDEHAAEAASGRRHARQCLVEGSCGKNVWSAPSVQGFATSPPTIPVA